MARLHLLLLLPAILAAALLAPASAFAQAPRASHQASTNPVSLSLKLAERYWHSTTSPEPVSSVVEMWTEVQKCTITINASLWPSWHQDDEFFQWFCDAMTHEVGHLFGHPDGGQTNPSSITYPFLSSSSPNFNSVPSCQAVTLQYGSEKIRDEEVLPRR
jgi:hypothetical protein